MNTISGKCELLKDKNGQSYLAVNILDTNYSPYANFMLQNNFQEDVERKLKRDSGCYHVTLINAAQWGSLNKKGLAEEVFKEFDGKEVSFSTHGVGKAEKDNNTAYFVILENEAITQLRTQYNLGNQDFHMTLAFNEKDVHGVSKNKETCVFSDDEVRKNLVVEKIKKITQDNDNTVEKKLKP